MILRSFIAVLFICLAGSLMLVGSASAHSPSPEAKAKFIAEGTWEQKIANLQAFEAAQDPAMYKDALEAQLARRASTSALGAEAIDTIRVVVLLVEFPDFSHTSTSYAAPGGETLSCYYSAEPANFDSLLFSVRGEDVVTNPTGSWTDFYMESSYGTVFIKGDVYGWFMAPNNYSYYVGNNDGLGGGAILASDACAAANDVVDFSRYAQGNSVPGVVVVHAGPGAEQGAYGIWSHRSSMSPSRFYDGVYLGGYTMQPEEQYITTGLVHMGVFAHEWGHVMGIQDWYDPSYQSEGIGDWSVMAGGSWNNGGRQPAHFDCYSKYLLKWNDMQWLTGNVLNAEIPQAETSPIAYALRDNVNEGEGSPNIWFVENRQQVGSDQYLPGHGLVIYHFNAYGTQSTPPGQPVNLLLSVEEADGRFDMVNNNNEGDATDPWPGGGLNKRHFHDYSVPNANNSDGSQSQISVLNITNSGPTMTADLGVVWAIPWPELDGDSLKILDVTAGNGNGVIEQGETVDVYLEVANRMRSTYWPTLTLATSHPDLVISANNQNMGAALGHLVNAENYLPIKVTVPEDLISTIVTFTLTITTDSTQFLHDHAFKNTFEFQVPIGKAQILLVDDDNNRVDDRRFTDCLDRLRYPYETWNKYTDGSPTSDDLAAYPYVFWMTGSYSPPGTPGSILTADDVAAMRSYMDGGGNLLVGSFSIPLQLATLDPTFMADYLKASLLGAINRRYYLGVAGSPLADGIMVFAETNGVVWNGSTPTLSVETGGQPAFIITNSGGTFQGDVCGVTYDGSYRSVFLTFGAEMTLSEENEFYDYVVTDTLVSRIIQFFVRGSATPVEEDGGGQLLPRDFALEQNYPNPFNPTTRISYSVGAGLPALTNLSVFNVLGQKVATLVNEVQGIGPYSVEWDGETDSGARVASGIYFYRLTHGEMAETKKMILMK